MKYIENIRSVADVAPHYMGFIFYEKSKRHFEGIIPELPISIKKTGVFVNEPIEIVVSLVEEYDLEVVQLHGDESPEYCKTLLRIIVDSLPLNLEVIKVFSVSDDFDFKQLEPYKDFVNYYLFDTKGKDRGGNGIKFNWSVLKNYPYSKPFFLSGGIGPKDIEEINKLRQSHLPIYAVDVNSGFESAPGIKEEKKLRVFKKALKA